MDGARFRLMNRRWVSQPVSDGRGSSRCSSAQSAIWITKKLERQLFLARRRIEQDLDNDSTLYIASLSTRTIAYKGMVMPEYLADFYPDLADSRLKSSAVVFHQRFSTNHPAALAIGPAVSSAGSQRRDQYHPR